jgi:hypothetical protein
MEVTKSKMIDATQRMLKMNSQRGELGGGINHAMKRHT